MATFEDDIYSSSTARFIFVQTKDHLSTFFPMSSLTILLQRHKRQQYTIPLIPNQQIPKGIIAANKRVGKTFLKSGR